MPAIPQIASAPRAASPDVAHELDLGGLPSEARAIVLQQDLDAREMSTLLGDAQWDAAIRTDEFDRAVRRVVQRAERGPLGRWAALGDWRRLADKADGFKERCPHAALLANLWQGSARLEAGAVSSDHMQYAPPVPDLLQVVGGSRLLRAPGRPPECLCYPFDTQAPIQLVSPHGERRIPPELQGLGFSIDQDVLYCEAIDSRLLGQPTTRWLVTNHDRTRAWLYAPDAETPLRPLPKELACAAYSAVSGNGRYVVAYEHHVGLLLHDCDTAHTTALSYPALSASRDAMPRQLSVDSEGVVFLATRDDGYQLSPGTEPRRVDLASESGNYRLSPNERHLVTNDATGTNLRLEDRRNGTTVTLRHPAAVDAADGPRILAMVFSPGMAWAATSCQFGTLSVYNLIGVERGAILDPALQVSLRTQRPFAELAHVAPWFDTDGSAINVGYTERRDFRTGAEVQLMRLPLV